MFATWDMTVEQIGENLAKEQTSVDVKRCRAHAMLSAKLSNRHAALGLAQDRKDLGFAKSRHLHQILLSHLAEKILRPHPLSFGEDYPMEESLRARRSGMTMHKSTASTLPPQ